MKATKTVHVITFATTFAAVIVAVLMATLISSCWHPAFDPVFSASEHTVSKLSLVSSFEVSNMQASSSGPALFFPRKSPNPIDGIWLLGTGGTGQDYVMTNLYCLGSLSVEASELYKHWSGEFAGGYYNYPMVMMQAGSEPGDPLEVSVLANKEQFWFAARFYESSAGSGKLKLDNAYPVIAGPGKILATGLSVQSPDSDYLFTIRHDDTTGEWVGAVRELSGWPLDPETVSSLSLPESLDPDGVHRPGFAARSDNKYYLSVIDASKSSRTFCWPEGLSGQPTELASLSAPLQAVLSDGNLLTDDGLRSSAFNAAGTLLYSFPSGSLRFIHERYDDILGEYIMVFTRNFFVGNAAGEGTLRIEVLEIPTARLLELAY